MPSRIFYKFDPAYHLWRLYKHDDKICFAVSLPSLGHTRQKHHPCNSSRYCEARCCPLWGKWECIPCYAHHKQSFCILQFAGMTVCKSPARLMIYCAEPIPYRWHYEGCCHPHFQWSSRFFCRTHLHNLMAQTRQITVAIQTTFRSTIDISTPDESSSGHIIHFVVFIS